MNIIEKIIDKLNKWWYEPHTITLSELRQKYPLNEDPTDDDIIQISHKRNSDSIYETRFMTLKQLKEYLKI